MRLRAILFVFFSALLAATTAEASPVLMISIDGLRPSDVLGAPKNGLKLCPICAPSSMTAHTLRE